MTTTIPFIAYEISGVKWPTYKSGAVNRNYLDVVSGALSGRITEAAGGGIQSAAFQTLAASTGVTPFTATVKVSGSVAQTISVLGYSTISSNAKKGQASGAIAFYESSDVDHDATTNFVANEHIDHSTVSITAGVGLTGGGTLEATRDIAVGAGTGIKVNANDIEVIGYATISSNAKQAATYMSSGNEYSAAYNWYTASAQKLTTQAKPAKASAQALKAHSFHAKISSSYLAANYGWAAITTGSKAIAHSLSGIPNIINVTPSGLVTFAYAVYNPNATNFTVAITAAGSRVIRWHAQI